MGGAPLSGAADHTIRVWGVESGRCLRVLKGHTDRVLSVAWSPDGRRALSGAADHTVRLWEVASGRCLRVLKGHTDRVLSVVWSPDGRRALSGALDHTVQLWEVESAAACGCSKATPTESGAWRGVRMGGAPFPGPLTIPCGSGRWSLAAACGYSKATPPAS